MDVVLRSMIALVVYLIISTSAPSWGQEPVAEMTAVMEAEYAQLQKELGSRPAPTVQERLLREALRPDALILESDRDPLDVVLRRTCALAGILSLERETNVRLRVLLARLTAFQKVVEVTPVGQAEKRRGLFARACELRRRISFANPLLDFDDILFLTRFKTSRGDNHMVDQYCGFNATAKGNVFVLEGAFSDSPKARPFFKDATVQAGRMKDRKLEGGAFLSLELDYDAKSVLFAWSQAVASPPENADWSDQPWDQAEAKKNKCLNYYWTPESTFHIFRANADGSGLTQLTDGRYNDFDPCFLPSGRIAFVSERRGGFLRCGGNRPNPTYTVHAMMPDGSDIIPISLHETHEWHPSVDNNGMLVYTRWDYIDRDSDIAHHIWQSYPDGRDPRSFHGNYPKSRESRPWMEMSIRAIPGSHKYVATSAPHHGQAYGSFVVIDTHLDDDDAMSQLRRLTPEVPLPESESAPGVAHTKGKHNPRAEVYGTAWPLSEDFYLCVYDPDQKDYGVYLLDSFGNRELLYHDPQEPCLDPIPFRPRPRPPVIPVQTMQAKADRDMGVVPASTISVVDVYDSDFDWPEGVQVKSLRIVQLFPKSNFHMDRPYVGLGDQSLTRGVLGTVPVESDGSAFFEVPPDVPLYFQALDERGLAVQNMRSDTYVHAGEQLSCQGCHEPKRRGIAPRKAAPLALRRAPSKITPEFAEAYPISFPRLVQGVLDRNCVDCHAKEKDAPSLSAEVPKGSKTGWSQSFETLSPLGWARHGGNGVLITRNKTSRSEAGNVGAHASKLFKMLEKGHGDVRLTPEDMRRITLWLDCNTLFYSDYTETEKQARGELVMPALF